VNFIDEIMSELFHAFVFDQFLQEDAGRHVQYSRGVASFLLESDLRLKQGLKNANTKQQRRKIRHLYLGISRFLGSSILEV
jgi:hypothetical protein